MNSSPLYLQIRDRLLSDIAAGIFQNGSFIPTERELSELFTVSRKTIRSALAELEGQGVLTRVQGRGTQITYNTVGVSAPMDFIALVASAQSPFFREFYSWFGEEAERHDSLVIFKEDSKGKLFRKEGLLQMFFRKGVRNLVVWPYNFEIDLEMIARARGLGMNVVFFDEEVETKSADAVLLDNKDSMSRLCRKMLAKKIPKKGILYLTFSDVSLRAVRERTDVFKQKIGGRILEIPFAEQSEDKLESVLSELKKNLPRGIICATAELAVTLRHVLLGWGIANEKVAISCIDDLPGMDGLGITRIAQPMKKFAHLTYELLRKQNESGRDWKAKVYRLKGKLLKG
ncbi:MAG: GntR family transcriptional regulator [Opitutaceae bacterium]|nr:GntR family transcriptional regulator [Opitutaceae bacterium]